MKLNKVAKKRTADFNRDNIEIKLDPNKLWATKKMQLQLFVDRSVRKSDLPPEQAKRKCWKTKTYFVLMQVQEDRFNPLKYSSPHAITNHQKQNLLSSPYKSVRSLC